VAQEPSTPVNHSAPWRLRKLLLGIKQRAPRGQETKLAQAEARLKSLRDTVLKKAGNRCYFCGFVSEDNEIHHLDRNQLNIDEKNLVPACKLCYPYHHIGEQHGRGASKTAALIRVPNAADIPAQELNHLMRAIAIALTDPKEAEMAKRVYGLIASTENFQELAAAIYGAENVFGEGGKRLMVGVNPTDMAQALSYLTDDEYAEREAAVAPLRVLFSPSKLIELGRGWKKSKNAQSLADPQAWEKLLERPLKAVRAPAAPPAAVVVEESISAESLLDDEEDEDDDD